MATSILDAVGGDAYGVISLTLGIEKLQVKPGRLAPLFRVEGVDTVIVAVEQRKNKFALVPAKTRGSGVTTKQPDEPENIRAFVMPHLPLDDTVMASEVQGKRAFGTADTRQTINAKISSKGLKLKQNIEVTIEYHRIGALQGVVKDADGIRTLFNYFTDFGVTEKVIDFDLDNATPVNVKAKCDEVHDYYQTTVGGGSYTGISAQVGSLFWSQLISHPSVVGAWEIFQESNFLRTTQREGGGGEAQVQRFEHCGIMFERYSGKIGDVDFIPAGHARFYPTGVSDLFIEYYGPMDSIDTVNTIGRPFYLSQEKMKHGKGLELHSESNPLVMATQPELLVKGTNT